MEKEALGRQPWLTEIHKAKISKIQEDNLIVHYLSQDKIH
jgi:hypothetical protein